MQSVCVYTFFCLPNTSRNGRRRVTLCCILRCVPVVLALKALLFVQLRKWADLLVIAPLDANTMAKMATGLCDNLLVYWST